MISTVGKPWNFVIQNDFKIWILLAKSAPQCSITLNDNNQCCTFLQTRLVETSVPQHFHPMDFYSRQTREMAYTPHKSALVSIPLHFQEKCKKWITYEKFVADSCLHRTVTTSLRLYDLNVWIGSQPAQPDGWTELTWIVHCLYFGGAARAHTGNSKPATRAKITCMLRLFDGLKWMMIISEGFYPFEKV